MLLVFLVSSSKCQFEKEMNVAEPLREYDHVLKEAATARKEYFDQQPFFSL